MELWNVISLVANAVFGAAVYFFGTKYFGAKNKVTKAMDILNFVVGAVADEQITPDEAKNIVAMVKSFIEE